MAAKSTMGSGGVHVVIGSEVKILALSCKMR